MKRETIKLDKIKPNPHNPRIIKDEKFHKLVKSIKEFPQMLEIRPIVVDENFIVLGGNMRLKASKEAGLDVVPVIIVNDLTEEQKKEFVIKDNANFGDWDWEVLQAEWNMEFVNEWGVDVFQLPRELDYSILEGDNDDEEDEELRNKLKEKSDNMRRALCIPFDSSSYEDAAKLLKELLKREDINVGAQILDLFKKMK